MPSLPSQKPHLSDPILQPFLSPTFDPTTYLNSTLPPLSIQANPSKQSTALSLTDHTTHTQTLLSQLSAQTSRLSTLLTQQTDDILRSGSRLAYEVEILRGETQNLTETLNDNLKADIARFVPTGLRTKESTTQKSKDDDTTAASEIRSIPPLPPNETNRSTDPPSITHLRTLSLVRTRLDSVLKTFDAALTWPLPPPESSNTFISVSAPASSTSTQEAQQAAQKLRDEITELFVSDGTGGVAGVEAADKRVQELRRLCEVWKGTVEEKSRGRFVDGLERMVEERRRAVVEGNRGKSRREESPSKGVGVAQGKEGRTGSEAGGYGFIDNLQRLRGNIYLE
ncbi:MAG: hypothetical protein M1835_003256 [Candelina submexicana]|nr:MAG: hypothetical protein M1835_003256 [Candelina submexicana]